MFSYDVFLWFKELKAKINQKWFGRVAPQVSVLPDHKAIFLLEDTDASQYHSSFNPMDDAEVNQIVTNLNATYNRYKAMGFDEIFLSIIPNKVSIVAPDLGEPNHAIERIRTLGGDPLAIRVPEFGEDDLWSVALRYAGEHHGFKVAAGIGYRENTDGNPTTNTALTASGNAFGCVSGATNIGGFHEGVSLAALWKLPVVFVCENNQYSMGTPLYRTLAVPDVTERASGYGIARDRFKGDDVLEVRDRIARAVERARKDCAPTLIEVETYRFRGHSISDPGNYRSKEEIETWKKRDAVMLARQRLVEAYGEDDIVSLDQSIKALVQEAVRFAETSPVADPAHLWDYIYAQPGTDPQRM